MSDMIVFAVFAVALTVGAVLFALPAPIDGEAPTRLMRRRLRLWLVVAMTLLTAVVYAAVGSPTTLGGSTPAGERIAGQIDVAPDLRARIAPGDTLFVYALATDGSPMPIAAVRFPVGAWPRAFALDDSMAMMPGRKLSSQAQVHLVARVTRSGQAARQAGDLEGRVDSIRPSVHGIQLKINRML